MVPTLYIASGNLHKIKEIAQILSCLSLNVLGTKEFSDYISPEETGTTFEENALIKAQALKNYLISKDLFHDNVFVLADDSGICCEDLKGAPGVYSAVFAGNPTSDEANNLKLLSELQKINQATRRAHYYCHLVLMKGHERPLHFEGRCDGVIASHSQGKNGFGYDPYFFLPHLGCHMAELTDEEKNKISHRSQAMQKLLNQLTQLL